MSRASARRAVRFILASVAVILLVFASESASADAIPDDAVRIPGESMAHRSFAKVVAKASALGGKTLRYSDPGRATKSVALPSGAQRLVLRARDASPSSDPRSAVGLRVLVDGEAVGQALVSSGSYAYHSFDAAVPAGEHRVAVEAYSLAGSEKAHVDNLDFVSDAEATAPMPPDCEVTVEETDDLDALVNSDPGTVNTKFCVAAGTHTVDETVTLKNGDTITGPIGTQETRGPANFGVPTAKVVGQEVSRVISVRGSEASVQWVDVSGGKGDFDPTASSDSCPSSSATNGCPVVGTGVGIALGGADGTVRVSNVRVHDNDAVGISNAKGRITNSEFFSNTHDPRFLGVVGAGIKGVTEFEAAFNYVHQEQGIGIWHDHSTSTDGNDPEMSGNQGGGSWFHHNLVVNNGRYGIRYESAPRDAEEGEHLPAPTFVAEDNVMAGNDNAGASHRDAQNAIWRRNEFGPTIVGGVRYGHNLNEKALVISDSGRSDRTDLWNADAYDNTLNGESISGCRQPDEVVSCSGNG